MPDLFHYTDYRHYLRDWVAAARANRKGFSFRIFAARAGLGAPGYLGMVIQGKRNLGESGLERFMNGMKLMAAERLYFRNLVLWNQAETDGERSLYEGKLALLRKSRKLRPAVADDIRGRIERFRGEIAGLLAPDFTPEEAAMLARQYVPEE
ncbi:MAG TPA: TIGR02147 family protein [bacterium]|nr:TIGR02147 family protein [bacterium]